MEKSCVFWILEEFVNLSPAARGYKFFLCSINIPRGLSAYKPQKLVVYCFYIIIIQKTRDCSVGLPAQ